MPRERINTPQQRTITLPSATNGLREGEWGLHFEADELAPVGPDQYREPTMAVALVWRLGPGDDEEAPPSSYLFIEVEVSAEEVLRKADRIRAHRLTPIDPADVPEGTVLAEVEYPQETATFATVALSRHAAQKLIATTRRARNAVFGGDE